MFENRLSTTRRIIVSQGRKHVDEPAEKTGPNQQHSYFTPVHGPWQRQPRNEGSESAEGGAHPALPWDTQELQQDE
jgi:hypothetical protein